MEWILNDLSLDNQFVDIEDFSRKILCLLKLKSEMRCLNNHFRCSRQLVHINVFENMTFSNVVLKKISPELKKQILSWVDKNGPFWTDVRFHEDDDYFEYASIDVTNLGLGECARRTISLSPVMSFSFEGDFSQTPLSIQHGLQESPLGTYNIDNIWSIDELRNSVLQVRPNPRTWKEAIDRFKEDFPSLLISDKTYEQMAPVPFSFGIFEGMCEKFKVLQCYFTYSKTPELHQQKMDELYNNHFLGKKAWFSNSNDNELATFKDELTFNDLFDGKPKQFPFHAKIKTPQLRIHFEWPVAPERQSIQVVYIGPKITKK